MPETQLDQEQTSQSNFSILGQYGASQSFTAGISGNLDKVSLCIGCCWNHNLDDLLVSPQGYIHVRVAGTEVIKHGMELFSPDEYEVSSTPPRYWRDFPLDPAPAVVAG